MANTRYMPLSRMIDSLPGDYSSPTALSSIIVVGQDTSEANGVTTVRLDLSVTADLEVSVAGLDDVTLVLPADLSAPVRVELDIGQRFELRVSDITPALRFASSLLTRVSGSPGNWTVEPDPVELSLSVGQLTVDQDLEPSFELDGAVSLGAVMIGDTGFVVEASDIRLYLSANQAPPAGREAGFRGIELNAMPIT